MPIIYQILFQLLKIVCHAILAVNPVQIKKLVLNVQLDKFKFQINSAGASRDVISVKMKFHVRLIAIIIVKPVKDRVLRIA